MERSQTGQGGFTLIEMMIAVVIIGILAVIGIPNFLNYQMRSRSSEAHLVLKALFTAESTFAEKYRRFALGGPSLAAAGSAAYLWNMAAPENAGFAVIGFKPVGSLRFCYSAYAGNVRPTNVGACGPAGVQTVFDPATKEPSLASSVPALDGPEDIVMAASADLDNDTLIQSQSMSDENFVSVAFTAPGGLVSGESIY